MDSNMYCRDFVPNSFKRRFSKISNFQQIEDAPSLWLSKRLFVCLVLFLSFMCFQIVRNNVNIAVVEMTTNKAHTKGNITTQEPDFDWDSTTIGLILSIFSYGGLFALCGGFMANALGGAVTCAICMMVAGITTVAHPASLSFNFNSFVALRFVTGLFETFFYVSTAEVFARWFPRKERSLLISISFNGTNAGVAIVYPFCGYMADKWGWEVVFYVTGAMAIFMALALWIFVKNSPSKDKWISKRETTYILAETDFSEKPQIDHPYKSIFTSLPVWSLCILLFTYMWTATLAGAFLPLYVKDVTHKGTNEIGLISSIPNIVFFLSFPFGGFIIDYWKNHSGLSLTRIHKIVVNIAFVSTTACFILAALMSDFTLSMIFFILIQIVTSPSVIIVEYITISLAPDHCNIVAGMSSFFFSLSGIVSQTVTGIFISQGTLQGWNESFYLAAIVSFIGTMFFTVFGCSDMQPWAVTDQRRTGRRSSVMPRVG